jgi:hypothetical protein
MPRHIVTHVAANPISGIPDARLERSGHLDAPGAETTLHVLLDNMQRAYSVYLDTMRKYEDAIAQQLRDFPMLSRQHRHNLTGHKLTVNRDH